MTATMTVLSSKTLDVPDITKQRHSRWILRAKRTLFEGEDYFVLSKSNLFQGKNMKNGKTWARWKEVEAVIVSARARGNGPRRLNIYLRTGDKSRGTMDGMFNINRNISLIESAIFDSSSDFGKAFDRLARKFFPEEYEAALKRVNYESDGIIKFPDPEPELLKNGEFSHEFKWNLVRGLSSIVMYTIYPGYVNWPKHTVNAMKNSSITLPMRNKDMSSIVRAMYGKTRYRKDLVKMSVMCENPFVFEFVYHLRRFVPVDWVVEVLRLYGDNTVTNHANLVFAKPLSEICALIPEARRRRFILSSMDETPWIIGDTIRGFETGLFNNDDFAQVRTLTELHDLLPTRRVDRRVGTFIDSEFSIEKTLAEKYHEKMTEDGLQILAPLKSSTLAEWSSKMGNCISGYVNAVAQKNTFVGGVYRDDKLIANFEITPNKELRQLLGKFNATLPEDVQRDIIDTLVSAKVVDPKTVTQAWGVSKYTPRIER